MEKLLNGKWNRITDDAELFPIIASISSRSSNSYVISYPDAIVIVDHGLDNVTAGTAENTVKELLAQKQRPVLMTITHSHTDHISGLKAYSKEFLENSVLLMHPQSVQMVKDFSAMFEDETFYCGYSPELEPDMILEDGAQCGVFSVRKEDGFYSVQCAGRELLKGYAAPGHTFDGLVFQLENILFIGDIFSSLMPGLTGAPGFSAGDVKQTALWLKEFSEGKDYVYCFGHASPKPCAEMTEQLDVMIADAEKYRKILPQTKERFAYLNSFSMILLNEVSRLFAVISGRIYVLAYKLQRLGEEELANTLYDIIEFRRIDMFLNKFRLSVDKANPQEAINVNKVVLWLMGIQMIKKIQLSIENKKYEDLIDPSILRRIQKIMGDFVNSVYGFPIEPEFEEIDLNEELPDLMSSLLVHKQIKRNLVNSVDSQEEFVAALLKSLAVHNILSNVMFSFNPSREHLSIVTSREYFFDFLQHIFERLAANGSKKITLSVTKSGFTVLPDNYSKKLESLIMSDYVKITADILKGKLSFTEDGLHIEFKSND